MIEALRRDGYVVLPAGGERDVGDPWSYVTAMFGARPEMVEVQPIKPRPDGRSFASTSGFTPFHTDSQDFLGVSPGIQIMVCKRAATTGGETRLLDGDRLLERLTRDNPSLHHALHHAPRVQPFYFGDVTGPTVAIKRGHRVWTHSPQPPRDAIGEALAAELAREPVIELAIETGQILIVDNHRMLHGRNAFVDRISPSGDDSREFTRLLVWFSAETSMALHRLAVVLELLGGAPPAKLAARERISEPELYAWRNRAFGAARDALQ